MWHPGDWDDGKPRDMRGRWVAVSDYESTRFESRWIDLQDYGTAKAAWYAAARIVQLSRGDWYFMGLVASVQVNGHEIGRAALWGIESDSDSSYLRTITRELIHDALRDARQTIAA